MAAVSRSWERLPAPTVVSWFTTRPFPQVLVEPAMTATITPTGQLTLTFSDSVASILGDARPRLTPAVPGQWQTVDAHTVAFRPTGAGFALGSIVNLELPQAVHLAQQTGTKLTRALRWQVAAGSTLRLEQLLAEAGYLPLAWQPTGAPVANSLAAQVEAAVSPPSGQFVWSYASTPKELQALWRLGQPNKITYGAVMMFEDTHGLSVDGIAGPAVWSALIADAMAGKVRTDGYSYVFVHRRRPQLLSLWHNGRVILTSPGNTGVPAARRSSARSRCSSTSPSAR